MNYYFIFYNNNKFTRLLRKKYQLIMSNFLLGNKTEFKVEVRIKVFFKKTIENLLKRLIF